MVDLVAQAKSSQGVRRYTSPPKLKPERTVGTLVTKAFMILCEKLYGLTRILAHSLSFVLMLSEL